MRRAPRVFHGWEMAFCDAVAGDIPAATAASVCSSTLSRVVEI